MSAAAAQQLAILDQFSDAQQEAAHSHHVNFRLTPHLVLASALLHMMASDGKIEEAESSQLQSVLGGDQHVMNVAVQYTKAVPLNQFLIDAHQVLDKTSSLCVLTNVCDSLLADGSAGPDELALFDRMKAAWGVDTAVFEPYQQAIALKNNDSVMGVYEADRLKDSVVTPHLALAASLLYMMAADGSIATEEIGQLQTVIGEFQGLQEAALKQVRAAKLPEFLKLASPALSPEVKLYILANVCDSMMADGDVDGLENKIFQTMLAGYGHDNSSFKPFYQSIKVKNIKTFSASVHKPKLIYSNKAGGIGPDEDGVRFNRDNSFNEQAPGDVDPTEGMSAKGPVISHVLPGEEGSHAGNRTMQENIEKVSQGFGDENQIHVVQDNALGDQKLGIPKAGLADRHVAKLPTQGGEDNLIPLHASANDPHVEVLPSDASQANVQSLARETSAINRQATAESQTALNRQAVDSDALQDSSASIAKTNISDNRQAAPQLAMAPSRQAVAQDGTGTNRVNAPVQTIGTHREKLPAPSPAIQINLNAQKQAAKVVVSSQAPKPMVPKAARVKQLTEHVKQLRLRLDQLAGLNHAVLQAAENAAGGNCTTCGNPRCLFTHHIH